MTGLVRSIAGLMLACVALVIGVCPAEARCTINAAGLTISPTTGSAGTHTPPAVPPSQAVTFTISGTYNTNATAGNCGVALAFNRATLPATMARSGGGATMPYSIRTAASGGGNTMIFTGGGTPAAGSRLTTTFPSAGPSLTNVPFSINVTAHYMMTPASPQRAGNYSDSLSLRVYNYNVSTGAVALRLTVASTATAVVSLACTIGGTATPAADSANIPVAADGTVTTSPIARSYLTVICNSQTNVIATSLNGAVRNVSAAPSGFTNMINYTAAATFSAATSNLNTSTIPTAAGSEAGSTATTASLTPTGTLSVTITPQTPASRLISGAYSDTLRITLTPF